jgi:DNA-binding protein HU-beta
MNKIDVIKAVATRTGLPASTAEKAIESLGEVLTDAILSGQEASLPGVGKLATKASAARTGRNPRTGETIQIPAGKRLIIRPSKHIKEALKP